MTVYSLRLALSTTVLGTLFVAAAASGVPLSGAIFGLLVLTWAGRSLSSTLRTFEQPRTRALVVSVVAAG
jgi:hypothetical protein